MKLFFLGGTSYLGKEIIKRLQSKGFEISVLIRSKESASKLKGLSINIVTDTSEAGEQDIVLNLVVDYGKNKDLSEVMSVNVDYPLRHIEKLKFKSIINFSTALDKDVSNYAFSKRTLEEKLIELSNKHNFQVINLRLQHFYGPGAPQHNFVTYLISRMKNDEDIPLTDGLQKRDFVYIEDVVDAIEWIISKRNFLSPIEMLDLGSGESIQVRDFVELIKELSHSKSRLLFGVIEKRVNEPEELVANIKKMRSLGWEPKYSFYKGISLTLNSTNNGKEDP